MAIKIISEQKSASQQISFDEIYQVIERNRDRVRALSGMIASTSGLFISVSFGVILFIVGNKEKFAGHVYYLIWLILIGLFLLLMASCLAIFSGVFRRSYSIIDQKKFLDDLLQLYFSEHMFLRFALICFFVGLLEIFASIVWFCIKTV